eukprot:scaffold22260_cov78-Skeletonema_dohrnii-CCMP3373.AAC.2
MHKLCRVGAELELELVTLRASLLEGSIGCYLRRGSCDEVVGRAQNTRNGRFLLLMPHYLQDALRIGILVFYQRLIEYLQPKEDKGK